VLLGAGNDAEVAARRAALAEGLAQQLPTIKGLAGLSQVPGSGATVAAGSLATQ